MTTEWQDPAGCLCRAMGLELALLPADSHGASVRVSGEERRQGGEGLEETRRSLPSHPGACVAVALYH